MVRLEKIIQNYKNSLTEKGIKDIPEFVQSILDADITKGKYSRFLLDCFLNDKFREEDLQGGLNSTIGQTVSLFHKHKNKLPEDMRSVYKYETPGDLWNAVKQFDGELSGKEVKKELQDKIYGETEFVYEDEETGFKIISPLTKEAAKWWGKGTRWCTSAEKNNMFWRYAKDAPLLIILMPGGEKLQLWKNGDDIQFMNEADNKVKINYIEQNWNILEPLCLWLKDLIFIPEKYKDYTIYLEAVKQNGEVLISVPEELKDYNFYMEAVKSNGYILLNIPEEFKDYKLCFKSIQQNGLNLEFVPKKLMDYNMCLEAVKEKGYSLRYVPEEYRSYDLFLEAVKQYGYALNSIPKELIDYTMCLEGVKKDGNSLYYVPEEYKDYNLCLEAVKQNGNSLSYVPEELIDYNMCLEAVKENGYSLYYVPESFQDYNIYSEAVKQNGSVLQFIPGKLRDYDLCLEAVKQNGNALKYVPKDHRDHNMCLEAVKQNGNALQFVPEEYQEKLKTYFNKIQLQIPEDIYQQTFSEIHSYFPEKELSLKM